MDRGKKPLYRKVNTRTHGVRHGDGGKARWDRNTKTGKADQSLTGSMHSKHRHGRDYTPLFRFLLSRVGKNWDQVFSEARSRLDQDAPIFWLVAPRKEDGAPIVRVGESTYYSGLFVDENGILRRVDPDLTVEDLYPSCSCCTHSFNGERYVNPFSYG